MGLYDRDYGRSYDTGSGWSDGPSGPASLPASMNGRLLLALGAVFGAQLLLGKPFTDAFTLHADWFDAPWRVYGALTYGLLHSPESVFHLLFNGLALFFFGRTIESRLGGREYLAFFLAAAAFAGLAWSVPAYLNGPQIVREFIDGAWVETERYPVLLGASGGIAAIVLLFALWYPHVQVHIFGVLPIPAWLMAVLFIGQDISGALSRSGNVAYTAHLAGALFGFLYFKFGWRIASRLPGLSGGGSSGANLASIFKSKPKLRVHREEDDDPAESEEDRVDEILRKIRAEGQDSLTREERRLLERASRRYQQRRR